MKVTSCRSTGLWRDLFLILTVSVFAWGALLAPGYFLKAHDAPHSLFFLLEFDKAFRDGAWYPRWGIDFALGYGYPLFSYYSPLAYYVAEGIHLLGVGLTDAVKITYALATALSGLAMYGLARRTFGRHAALLAAVLYMFVPYHLLDLYVRSSFAEYTAFVFLPLVFWAFYNLLDTPSLQNVALAALAFGGLILTHNATFMMTAPLLVVYGAFLFARSLGERSTSGFARRSVQRLAGALAAGLLALALGAVLLLPVLLERDYIAQGQWTQGSCNYAKHFTYPGQLLSPFWGYGYAGEGLKDDMSLQLGIVPVVLALFAWVQPPRRGYSHWVFFFATTIVLILLMTPISAPVWAVLPLVSLVQFPWRLLILAAVTLSMAAAALLAGDDEPVSESALSSGFSATWVLCLVALLASLNYTVPQYTPPNPRSETEKAIVDFETYFPPDRVGMVAWTLEQPKTSPLVEEYLTGQPLNRAHILSGEGEVQTLRSGGRSIEIGVSAETSVTVQFYVYYFPGWEAWLDGQTIPTRPEGPQGLLTIDVPSGEHRVVLIFTDTPMGARGQLISGLALVIVLGLLTLGWFRARRLKRSAARG